MPKEIFHLAVACDARSLLPENGQLARAVAANQQLYLLGAVSYDTAFYKIGINGMASDSGAAQHGFGSQRRVDDFFLDILSVYGADTPPPVAAFIAGLLTHKHLDSHFHPLINYFSGRYSETGRDSGRYRHTALETALDLHITASCKITTRYYKQMLNQLDAKKRELLYELVALFFSGKKDGQENDFPVKKLVANHARLQKLFFCRPLRLLLNIIDLVTAKRYSHLTAAFYPLFRKRQYPFFNHGITYRRPVSGVRQEVTVAQLRGQTLRAIGEEFYLLETYYSRKKMADYFSRHESPSPATGETERNTKEKYFDTSKPIKDLLFKHNKRRDDSDSTIC